MTKYNKDKIVGGVIVALLFGIPLAIFLGPVALGVFITTLIIGLLRKKEKHTPRKTTERLQQANELVAVVLPTIKNNK